ncbi:MAG: LCCL domain-containing protein, partial [Myxococcota bacterium]
SIGIATSIGAGGACVPFSAQDVEVCGGGGRRCGTCADDQRCEEGVCRCISTCREDEVGTMRCADASTAETCQTASDGCWRWTPTDCAAGGARCEEGACVGGCGRWNCDGCCEGGMAEPSCVALDDQDEDQCGRTGSACRACAQGDRCVGGACECRGAQCEPRPRAGSRGDPHLTTFDGLGYDFQAAGEFVLVRDPEASGEDALEIQARQVPIEDDPSCTTTVSLNRAVAVQLGGSRVSFDAARAQPLWVDGLAVAPPPFEAWPLGLGSVMVAGSATVILTWPDGSRLTIDGRRNGPLNLGVLLAEGRRGAVVGLLGDGDGDPSNDLRIRDGDLLDQPVPFEQLYGAFADSWRITDDTSLLDYAPGEGTARWTRLGYPTAVADLDSIDPARRASALELCTALGIIDPIQQDACVLDIACTGDPGHVAGLVEVPPPDRVVEVLDPVVVDLAPCARTGGNFLDTEPADGCREGNTYCQDCPANCPLYPVWGTDQYHEESSLCTAAIHAGHLNRATGGRIFVEFPFWEEPYVGSTRNGVTSIDRASWPVSFHLLPPP